MIPKYFYYVYSFNAIPSMFMVLKSVFLPFRIFLTDAKKLLKIII